MTADGTYRPARAGGTITTAAELDALPVGSVVLADATHQDSSQGAGSYPLAFQRLYDGKWHRGGRSRDTDPDFITPATVLFRPDAPQPATTDDAVERAAVLSPSAIRAMQERHDAQMADRTHLGHAPRQSEIDRGWLLRHVAALAAAGAGAAVDREPERRALAAIAEETEGHPGLALLHSLATGVVGPLAARGDAAAPTEVEWGVRVSNGTVQDRFGSRDEAASWALDVEDGMLMRRTVSTWREVS